MRFTTPSIPVPKRGRAALSKATTLLTNNGFGFFTSSPAARFHPLQYTPYQQGVFSKDSSDHLLAMFSLSTFRKAKAANMNAMMQANNVGRVNTAFGHAEDIETYRKRYENNIKNVVKTVIENPDIAILAFQEAPIKEEMELFKTYLKKYLPDDWSINDSNVTSEGTNWGVFTIINHQKLKTSKPVLDTTLTEGIQIKDLDIRCRTFVLITEEGQIVKFTNLHLPHGKTEEAFNEYMTNVIKDVMNKGANLEAFSHSLLGDWNIDAARMSTLLQDLIKKEIDAAPKGKVFPFTLSATLTTSLKGHKKYNPNPAIYEDVKLSVDSLLTLTAEPAEKFAFTFDVNIHESAIATAVGFAGTIFVRVAGFSETATARKDDHMDYLLDDSERNLFDQVIRR